MRACQHYARGDAGIRVIEDARRESDALEGPFFNAYSRLVHRDDDSDAEDAYADGEDNFRVYRTKFTWNRDDIVSKCFHNVLN